MLAAAFRFIRSVGIWLVAPLLAALGYFTGAAVLGLFLILDLLSTYLIEPRVAGKSVGLAPVPLLLAVIFWTGLWGIVGLVLVTPVTVCLAVLGRHVRQLRFLAVLLGREAALRPAARYYQRLLARDRAEAVVKEYVADHSIGDLFDRVLIPALVLVRRGRKAGELRPEDEEFIVRLTQEIVRGLAPSTGPVLNEPTVIAVPATDAADAAALLMLRCLSGPAVALSDAGTPDASPAVVLIAAVGLTEARYLCRRFRGPTPGREDPRRAVGIGSGPEEGPCPAPVRGGGPGGRYSRRSARSIGSTRRPAPSGSGAR